MVSVSCDSLQYDVQYISTVDTYVEFLQYRYSSATRHTGNYDYLHTVHMHHIAEMFFCQVEMTPALFRGGS